MEAALSQGPARVKRARAGRSVRGVVMEEGGGVARREEAKSKKRSGTSVELGLRWRCVRREADQKVDQLY